MLDVYALARKIKEARVCANLSQGGLAKKLGLSDKTVSAYELGRAIPPVPTLQKIATVTNQPIEAFFEKSKNSDKIRALEKKIDILTDELKKISQKI